MQKLILSFLILFVFSNSWADEIVTLKNGQKVVLKDNGTWSYVTSSVNKEIGSYKNIDFIDLKLDIRSLGGKKIKTQAIGEVFEDVLLLTQDMEDMNPLTADITNISRNERKYILTQCNTGCKIIVYGTIGEVDGEKGIIAEKVKW